MSKQLYLIRHADAEHNTSIDDFDRKLSAKGRFEAQQLVPLLKEKKFAPELILCSPSSRTLQTCKIITEGLSIPFNKIQPENTIYEAHYKTLLSVINHIDPAYSKIALVGHNPGISMIIEYLVNGFFGFVPTAGVVKISFSESNWEQITENSGEIDWQLFPSDIS